jgi:hypothetical protein
MVKDNKKLHLKMLNTTNGYLYKHFQNIAKLNVVLPVTL